MGSKEEVQNVLADHTEGLVEKYLDIPNFASEAEEADWWPQQEDALFKAFQKADASGDLGCGTAASTAELFPVPVEDALLARKQASGKGVPITAHLQSLLHKALIAEEQSNAS